MRLPLTPSGLTIDRVRSSAIRIDLSQIKVGERESPGRIYCPALRTSGAVYLGWRARGNLAYCGSARLVRTFCRSARERSGTRTAQCALQTEKLSPQPHSPLT